MNFARATRRPLPFADDSFDAVVCAYGGIHVPVPETALREMPRVVRLGGRVAISVWDSTTSNNGFGMIYAAIRSRGNLNVAMPHGPDFFQFSTDDKVRAALAEVGFSNIETKLVDQHWHVRSGAQMLEVMRTGTVRAAAVVTRQSKEAFASIEQFLDDTLVTMGKNPAGGFDVPLPALIGSGEKN